MTPQVVWFKRWLTIPRRTVSWAGLSPVQKGELVVSLLKSSIPYLGLPGCQFTGRRSGLHSVAGTESSRVGRILPRVERTLS